MIISIQLKVWAMSLCGNVSTFPVKHKGKAKKVRKGAWRMPRLKEAMKDVISCVKPR